MMQDIIFVPLIAPTYLYVLGCGVAIITAFAWWRGLSGWPLRAVGMAGLILVLAQPAVRHLQTDPREDIALVVVDRTTSQTLSDRDAQTDQVEAVLLDQLAGIANMTTRHIVVRDAEANQGTRLFDAIQQARQDIPASQLSAIFLVSDGQVHDVPAGLSVDVPMHHIVIGQQQSYDRKLTITRAPSYAILGEPVTMTLRVDDMGQDSAPQPVTVTAQMVGKPAQRFTVLTGQDSDITLNLSHAGQTVFEFEVEEWAGELTTVNNRAVLPINGIRDRLRVLLVSGMPHAGARVWRNLLKSDSSVDLVHFTILRPPEKQDGVPVSELSLIAFPTRELFMDKIDDFDLIIFDRYKRRGILPMAYLDNIAEYVEQGGAVLVAAGPDFASAQSLARSPLDRILPGTAAARVLQHDFVPQITDIGRRHPVTDDLEKTQPWGAWHRQIEITPKRGTVVMTGVADNPLLVLDRVGAGRVALLASDHVWLWYRQFDGGGPQQELLRRVAHWLMKEPELEEEKLFAQQDQDRIVIERRTLSDTVAPLTVESPTGDRIPVELMPQGDGAFTATIGAGDHGIYEITDGTLSTVVAVGAVAPIEYDRPLATTEVLAPIVAATKGGQIWATEGVPRLREVAMGRTAAGRRWLGVVRRGAFDVTDIRVMPLLPAWLGALLILIFVVGAWLREGRR